MPLPLHVVQGLVVLIAKPDLPLTQIGPCHIQTLVMHRGKLRPAHGMLPPQPPEEKGPRQSIIVNYIIFIL